MGCVISYFKMEPNNEESTPLLKEDKEREYPRNLLKDLEKVKQEGEHFLVPVALFRKLEQFVKEKYKEHDALSTTGGKNVQLVHLSTTTASTGFVQCLREDLKEKANINLVKTDSPEKMRVKVVVCVILTNVETDVVNCLESFEKNEYERIVLIALHVVTENNLPERESEHILKDLKIGKVLDMGYNRTDKLYSCRQNRNALEEITKFIESDHHSDKQESTSIPGKRDISQQDQPTKQKKDNHPRGKTYKVHIMDPVSTASTTAFVDEFCDVMQTKGVMLYRVNEKDMQTIHPDSFIIVVCNSHSRINTDVDDSLKVVEDEQYGKLILLVLHVAEERNLPLKSSKRTLEDSNEPEKKYTKFGAILDMAFTKDKGIYKCKLNENAYKELKDTIEG